jgi:Fe-S-cluster containining protein
VKLLFFTIFSGVCGDVLRNILCEDKTPKAPRERIMQKKPFYAGGLRFSCTRCSSCCRYESGYVFLSQKDAFSLAAKLEMAYTEFIAMYCRWIPQGNGFESLSLREKSSLDCIFWEDGCTVYEHRPLQCRAFPFWEYLLSSRKSWQAAVADCPGAGKGSLHSGEEIEAWLRSQRAALIITRRTNEGFSLIK